MKTVKFYALCCRNLKALKRHQQYVSADDLAIVINTLDEEFKSIAVQHCVDNNLEHYVTESDGTPSTGKNSVFDLFAESDYDYMVLIDGDDFITPHGVWAYKQIANSEEAIDALALAYQYGIWPESGYDPSLSQLADTKEHVLNPYLGVKDKFDAASIPGYPSRCFLQTKKWWEDSKSGNTIDKFDEFSEKFSDVHKRWANLCFKYISNWETHLRLVMFSKKAVINHRHNTDFVCGEDTLLYLDLKDAHVNGSLKLKHLFDRYPTYVYDCRVDGIIRQEKDKVNPETGLYQPDYGWFHWLEKLADKYEEYETLGKMHEREIDYVDLPIPEEYTPNVLNLVNYPGSPTVKFY